MALDVQHKQQIQQNHVLGCVGAHQCYTTHINTTTSSSSVFNFDLNLSHHHHKPAVVVPITLDLFHTQENASSIVELDEPSPLPFGWQKCLNLKTGEIYYTREKRRKATNMSRNGKNPRLDLKLNLSPPRAGGNQHQVIQSPNRSATSSPISPPSSCVSSELNNDETLRYSNSPEATSMVLVGCPRCLMYVMLSEEDPKCPKCKSTVLLDFAHDNNTKKTKKN